MAAVNAKSTKDSCLLCQVCSETNPNIRRLPCEHVICFGCVQNIVEQNKKKKDNHECPVCKGSFAIPVLPPDRSDDPKYVREKYKYNIDIVEENSELAHNSKVMGMAVLNDDLFVVCKDPPNIIYKYGIADGRVGAGKAVELALADMKWPRGMAASESLSCLYITDWSQMFAGLLWRYKYRAGQERAAEEPVAKLDVQPFGVSVSPLNDLVLVTCATPANIFQAKGWIYVYKANETDFSRLRIMELPSLEIPRHSLLSTTSRYFVCHGWTLNCHGVTCFLENEQHNLRLKTFYGCKNGGGSGIHEMKRPLSMNFDEDGLILAVDYENHRIQLLTEDLYLLRHLITKSDHGIEYPRHVCQHPKTGKMFVSQEDGKVLIFSARHV